MRGELKYLVAGALLGPRGGPDVLRALKVYVWPLEQRKRNDRGQHGTLHAKCVLVDSDRLFVSSANMTSFALELNIELGVLLNGGDAPRQMEKNLTELIRTGVLREHKSEV